MIGDSGQISPVIEFDVNDWRCDPAGPHVPAPAALIESCPWVRQIRLPVSRRLRHDTVALLQPFYPDLPFRALPDAATRAVGFRIRGASRLDHALDAVAGGASMVRIDLPAKVTGERDDEAARTIVALAQRHFERETVIVARGVQRLLLPNDIIVACTHVSQVAAVQRLLPVDLRGLVVDTFDRVQGLEAPIVISLHPLSGLSEATPFDLASGRLCVGLSRHTHACYVVGRAGIDQLLSSYAPAGERVLAPGEDSEFRGWANHQWVVNELARLNRVVEVS
jgi:hypothetical protein